MQVKSSNKDPTFSTFSSLDFFGLDKLGHFLVLKRKVDSGQLKLRGSVASFLREGEREKERSGVW